AAGCSDDPPPVKPGVVVTQTSQDRRKLGRGIAFEVDKATGTRRVYVSAYVSIREGQLEGFLSNKNKHYEYILVTDADAEQIHAALEAAGAVAGSPVTFGQGDKYTPANGSVIKVSVQYTQNGKQVTVRAQDWIRNAITKKPLEHEWVFGGSRRI